MWQNTSNLYNLTFPAENRNRNPSFDSEHVYVLLIVCRNLFLLAVVMKAQWALYVPHSGHYMYRTVVTVCTAQW